MFLDQWFNQGIIIISNYFSYTCWISDKTPGADPKGSTPGDEECSVCLSKITDKKTLDKCGHSFCAGCIDEAFKHQKKCPICSQVYGQLIGNQPPGTMIVSRMSISLRGYESCGSITITYKIEDGVQGPEHPNPGKRYFGTVRSAHLPDNEEGNKILRLLQKAFDQKLTFTIGRSSTTGATNVVTWNDIHHKTKRTGGPTRYDKYISNMGEIITTSTLTFVSLQLSSDQYIYVLITYFESRDRCCFAQRRSRGHTTRSFSEVSVSSVNKCFII